MFFCSAIATCASFVFAGGGISGASTGTTPTDGPSRPPSAVTRRAPYASHDDGNYFLYVSVDTVIRGLTHSHSPARQLPRPRES